MRTQGTASATAMATLERSAIHVEKQCCTSAACMDAELLVLAQKERVAGKGVGVTHDAQSEDHLTKLWEGHWCLHAELCLLLCAVHGLLPDVPRRRRAQGRQRSSGDHQDQAHNPVCGLVPHRLQVRHQLPAAHRRARRRPRQGPARCLHDLQLHRHRRGAHFLLLNIKISNMGHVTELLLGGAWSIF